MNIIAMRTEISWLMNNFMLGVQELTFGIMAILLGHLWYRGNCNNIQGSLDENNLKIISFQSDIFYQDLMPGQQVFRAWSTTVKSHIKVLENTDLPFFWQVKYLFGYQIFKTLAIHTLAGFFSQPDCSEYPLCHLALISSSPVTV
jgi:ABC-type uncharacterized transport system permease subunit